MESEDNLQQRMEIRKEKKIMLTYVNGLVIKWFPTIAEGVRDISNAEQLSVSIKWVVKGTPFMTIPLD